MVHYFANIANTATVMMVKSGSDDDFDDTSQANLTGDDESHDEDGAEGSCQLSASYVHT